jgi:hypothetical protein
MGMTATQLGSTFGRGAAAMNVLLRDHGFLEGSPGAWRPTELGKQFAKSVDFDNGYGGYAHRSWGWLSWSDGLIDALKASIEANPDGIVPSVPATVAKAASASATGAGGQAFGKYKWVVMAAIGVVAVAAPVAKNVRNRITEGRAAAATDAASEDATIEDSAVADSAVEDPAVEDD